MKKLFVLAFALMLTVALASGTLAVIVQEPDTCEEISELADKACAEAKDGVDDYAEGRITKESLDSLVIRCRAMRLAEDTCPTDPT
ncbi:MAG: hypothetical protein F4Z31_04395 [Gemmatimonadetes bacterium]|nr:hypothetical protein [bacterium]MYA40974.1 hypothetical protein [Gemmatimonadota bacterium]MYE94406.1 hypothetical protein [Gemmatimonadota bacterium]MYJ09728.1 hypothetical protein [Gemmatimonadota bacterium]